MCGVDVLVVAVPMYGRHHTLSQNDVRDSRVKRDCDVVRQWRSWPTVVPFMRLHQRGACVLQRDSTVTNSATSIWLSATAATWWNSLVSRQKEGQLNMCGGTRQTLTETWRSHLHSASVTPCRGVEWNNIPYETTVMYCRCAADAKPVPTHATDTLGICDDPFQ